MILVIVALVGVERICYLAIVDHTMVPALAGWLLIFFIWPPAGSNCVAKLR